MMPSRIFHTVLSVFAAAASFALVDSANALDGFWQGDVSSDWNTAGNWYVEGAGAGGYVPQAPGGFNIRAIIGTDSPNGALNTTAGNSPVISAALPGAKQTVGGLYLGLRELDYTFNPPALLNPAPAPGALVGALTISGGTLNNVSTGEAGFGADGNIRVGVDGRGFLTMTGGTLTGQSLVVGGEEFSGDSLGNSLVDLSGTATLSIVNSASAANGTAEFNRRLRIEGPNVNVTTGSSVRFGADSDFTAVITGPTTHAMIQAGSVAYLGGNLNVEFSGAGATHSVGDTWDLIDATVGLAGNFNNLGIGNEITVSGLPSDPPVGAAYFINKVDGAGGHKLMQLSYQGVLVLHVNRDTGELRVTNPQGGDIDIDAYTVRSALGSMKNTYSGITTDSGWMSPGNHPVTGDPLNNSQRLTQWKQTGVYDVSGIGASGVTLGSGFDPLAVGGDSNNFGTDGEDLIFEYTTPFGGILRGQIEYEGTKFENDLVLRVNPNTGEATLKNDSHEVLNFDGYAVESSTSALNGAGWTGLGGSWDQSPASSGALTETNLSGSITLMPGEEVAIGDISSSGFATQADQDGLNLQFILSQGFESAAPGGDYNDDGVVDAADYTVWRDNFGQSIALANENPDATTPGVVDQEDYDFWRGQYGASGAPGPETEFRTGSVVFDATLSSLGAASSAAPEPGACVLLLTGLGAWLRSSRRRPLRRSADASSEQRHCDQGGGIEMPTRIRRYPLVLLAVMTASMTVSPAGAATQGIPLTNYDFELPGPVNVKTIAFDETGTPLDNIPGWTFPGPGVEDFGHEDHEGGDALGDSGTEGGGAPGNEMLLSTFDGVAYQTSSFNVVSVPSTQAYRLSFDAHNIFTVLAEGAPTFDEVQNQLEARLFYLGVDGTTRNTIGSPLVISGLSGRTNYTLDIVGGSGDLTPALGRPIGVEFDVTSDEFNPTWVEHSWAGVDNVLLQITGLMEGDFDGDGDVDLTDYGIVRDHQQQAQLYNAQGEMTGDGLVDLNDFRAFKTAYDAQNGAGALAAAIQSASVPEPTTAGLVLMLAAVAACGKRRRWLAASVRPTILAVVGLVAAASPVSAELLFYDPFLIGSNPSAGEYTADAPLAGQNPVAPYGSQPDLLSGAWVATATNGQVKAAPGLNYIGAPAEGGSIGTVPDPETFDSSTRVGRFFKPGSEWTDATAGTYYISWLQNFGTITNVTDDMGFRAMEFWSDPGSPIGDPNLLGDLGYNAYYSPLGDVQQRAATARLAFQHQIIEGSPVFFEDGATHLLVMKFVLSDEADSDVISVYLDPISSTEPDLPNLSITGTNVQLAALGMGQFGGGGPTYNTVDEIRIATEFFDALPPLPIPGDTDGDRDVDLDDLNNIVSHMNAQVGTALEGDVAKADGTQGSDGRVTIADFRIWKDNYPFPIPAGALNGLHVPEPASWAALLVAAAPLAGARHRGRSRLG